MIIFISLCNYKFPTHVDFHMKVRIEVSFKMKYYIPYSMLLSCYGYAHYDSTQVLQELLHNIQL